jgi:hypothetical protein
MGRVGGRGEDGQELGNGDGGVGAWRRKEKETATPPLAAVVKRPPILAAEFNNKQITTAALVAGRN